MPRDKAKNPAIRRGEYGPIGVSNTPLQLWDEALECAPKHPDGTFKKLRHRRMVYGLLRLFRTKTFTKKCNELICQAGAEADIDDFDYDADDEAYARKIIKALQKKK